MKSLMLFFNEEDDSCLEMRVFASTLEFLATVLESSFRYTYLNDNDLILKIQNEGISVIIADRRVPFKTALLLKGLGIVQIVLGAKPELHDIVDIIIDPFIDDKNGRSRFFTGAEYLLPAIAEKVGIDAIAGCMKVTKEYLSEVLAHSDAERTVFDICSLFKMLEWDSSFFGLKIAYVSCRRLTTNIDRLVRLFTRANEVNLIEYLCNCHDKDSVEIAELSGYSFVDIRMTFGRHLHGLIESEPPAGYSFAKGVNQDIGHLKIIAHGIYQDSRYYYDGNFDRKKVIEFYEGWVEKAIKGTFDDYAYVAYAGHKPAAFCTVKESSNRAARIGLVGVDKELKGIGLGKKLLLYTLDCLALGGKEYVEVITQGRNYEAQRLYQKCGFVTQKSELWYHKWMH